MSTCGKLSGASAASSEGKMGNDQRTPSRVMGVNRDNPFFELPLFRKTRDGRHVVALNLYPRLHARALNFLRCSDSPESVSNAILQWRAEELEAAAAEAGIVIAMVRTNDEFLQKSSQYTDVLSRMPLITVGKNRRKRAAAVQARREEPIGRHSRARTGARDCRSWHRQRLGLLRCRRPQHLEA